MNVPLNPPTVRLLSPRLLFVAGSLLVLLALTLSPDTRTKLEIFDHGRWFLDSYAVLASSDAAQAGLDPNAPMASDVFHRPHHNYSNWWFGLGGLGLTRADNFLVGGAWVLAFLATVFLTVKPNGYGEALWLTLLLVSPPVLLGLIRANADLLIFAILGAALLALRTDGLWRTGLAIAAVALAAGLKFYPAAAGFVFLLLPGSRRMLAVTGAATLVLAAVLAMLGSQVFRGAFHVEPEIYTMGGRIWLMDLGLAERPAILVSLALMGASALVAVRCGWTKGLAGPDHSPAARQAMTMASALLVTCFLGAINFGYRWIFALWLAPWLWTNRRQSGAARGAVWLLPFCLWHDGILCLATACWFPHLKPEQYDRILVRWRLATEPFTWLLLILLGGWLLELALARWREVRAGFRPPKGQTAA